MEFNEENSSWEGTVQFEDSALPITIGNSDQEGNDIDENRANMIKQDVETILSDLADDIKESLADFVVQTYNEEWSLTEKELTTDEVFDHLKFHTVDVADGAIVTIYLQDGGLFEDHSVAISYDLIEEELWEPELLG